MLPTNPSRRENSSGLKLTATCSRAISLTEKRTGAENTFGQMGMSMTVTGWMASAPAKEESHGQTATLTRANGRTENSAAGASSSNTANPRAVKHI